MKFFLLKYSTKIRRMPLKHLLLYCFAGRQKALPGTMLMCLLGILMSVSVFAQNAGKIQGTVADDTGSPLPGVTVMVKGTAAGAVTDIKGIFQINAKVGQTLVFNFMGYAPSEVLIKDQTPISLRLTPTSSSLNEVVVVGYGTQKKGSLTSAVSQIGSAEITTTKNENILNTLTGKIPGLRVVQNTSEPGSFNNSFDIRGMGSPLIVIDGVPRTDIARVDPNDVETVSVLKDASAAVYGVRAANGVILITTKKGKKGAMELNYSGIFGLQVPSDFPSSVNAVDYMTLVNEQSMHNVNGGHLTYQPADFAPYLNGTKQSTDWHAATVNKSAAQMQQSLSASGGGDNSSYFVSLGMTGQDGILKSNDLDYKKYNFRSNISTKVMKDLTFDFNVSGTMDQKNQPYQAPYYIFRSMWYQPPTNTVYANNNPLYLNNLPNPLHPVAQSESDVSGYQILNNKWFQSSASLTYSVPSISGLSAKALFSFDDIFNDNKMYNEAYNLYSYNSATNVYTPTLNSSPSTIRREFYEYPTTLSQFSLNYNHSFSGGHNVSALLLYEQSTRNADNFYAQRELSIPVDQLLAGNSLNQIGSMSTAQLYTYKNAAYVGSFNYDYKLRYMASFKFRYDGSSRFADAKQWGFFPDAELGWRLSEEGFWKATRALSFINSFKLRASYGETGDDSASTYQFDSGYTYPASGSATGQPPGAVFDGTFINGVQSKGIPNPNITWYTSKIFDAGVDIEAWNGLLGITFDYFVRNRSGLLATQLLTLPDVVGASLPQQNLNGDRTKGFDFEVNHRNRIGKFAYNIKATFGMTNTMNTVKVQAVAGNSYLNWLNGTANRNNNIYFGYGSSGQYQNYKSIENSDQYSSRSVVVGDYKYQDWNNDGQVGVDDSHPIATTGLPLITYGFNLGGSYQNFDFNFLFQGAAQVNASYLEQLNTPLWAGGNALSQFLDRWHPADPTADPYSPSTVWVPGYYSYTGTVPFTNTLENLHSAAYLRLKSAEIGYNLPAKWMGHSVVKGVRIFANAYNLLTITNLKYLDPEHPSAISVVDQQFGYAYPLDKIYSFGVNVKF
jgi:TonB-linked SusC/RagA family outer membrane protein